jgi:hypothetical protein
VRDVDIEAAVPPPTRMTRGFRRWLAVLVGLTAVAAASISWVEAEYGRQEEQAFVDASRGALGVFVKIAASQPRRQFKGDALRAVVGVDIESTARLARAPLRDQIFNIARAESRAEEAAARRLRKVFRNTRVIDQDDPSLDPAALEAVGASTADVESAVEEQNQAVDDASRYGTRQERGFSALGLVAIAASMLGLAGLIGAGRTGRIVLVTAGCALFLSVLWTASAFV